MRRALAFLCLLALSACGSELRESDPMFRLSDDSGSIKIPLLGSDASGKQYRLRKATFELSGNAMLTLQGRNHDHVSTPAPQGDYQMFLRPGYELVERDPSGNERVVPAYLTPNPARLHVTARTDGAVALSFRAEHGDIVFGQISLALGPARVDSQAAHDGIARGATVLASTSAP
jgi:hypothetical protein